MRNSSTLVLFVIVAVCLGCGFLRTADDEFDQMTEGTFPPEIQKTMQAMAERQAQGLDNAEVIVHRAYNYHGFSWIEPVDGAKLAAVDVEFINASVGFDLDDIDIIDGATNENYGSDPDIAFLDDQGELLPDDYYPDLGEPIRVLLIYAVRDSTESIKLGYWGNEIVSVPVPLEGNGPVLPEP